MIKSIKLTSFGPISNADCNGFGQINLFIGHNGSGKTFLLKSLYAALKTVEAYKRGKEQRSEKEILSDKLYWTFQAPTLGELVKKGDNNLHFSMKSDTGESFSFSFGNSTIKSVASITNSFEPKLDNTIFLPAKEILSLRDVILEARENFTAFGFDDCYYDLAKALRPTTKGRNVKSFSDARKKLDEVIGGRIGYDEKQKTWFFYGENNRKYDMSITSEGIKKISILDALLGNHYLSKGSVVIIDEAEANLHPEMIAKFLDIVYLLAKGGLQFFISTHSYFVIKKLYILAQQQKMSIPTWSFENSEAQRFDLKDEMPENAIVNESIRLYKEEIGVL
ncbi:MAG: AAA family ATPase [Salinivirgaceae bacterium]|nr:AAA family ATPase [Salinivirgaceae bacterium]